MKKKIAILGCGYLGTALAKHFSKLGYMMTGTTASLSQLKQLSSVVTKEIYAFGHDYNMIEYLLKENETLFITLAPISKDTYRETFLETAKTLRKVALDHTFPIKNIIFCSHVRIYGDHSGKWVDEESPLLSQTKEDIILIETEKLLQSLTESAGWNITILRLAELYGPGRELSKLAKNIGKKVLPGNGDFYTNMVHLQDVVLCFDHVLTHQLVGVYNLADDDHQTRKELYDLIAKKYKLAPIRWNPEIGIASKANYRASNHKIKSAGYHFQYPRRVLI